jgi:hypothetical protein
MNSSSEQWMPEIFFKYEKNWKNIILNPKNILQESRGNEDIFRWRKAEIIFTSNFTLKELLKEVL